MDMDMVRPWKAPLGLPPSLRPWEAWAVLTVLCGSSRPVGPPQSLCDTYLAVYATATVVVTVAAGARCAWYWLTRPFDAEQSPLGPGT